MGWLSVFGDVHGAMRDSNVVAEYSQTTGQSRLGNFGERVSRQSRHYDGEERLPNYIEPNYAANWLLRLTY